MESKNKKTEEAISTKDDKLNKTSRIRNNKRYNGSNGTKGFARKIPKQDPFFYAKDQKALNDMASLPFNAIVGDKLFKNGTDRVPYIMVMNYVHAINCGDFKQLAPSYPQRAADAFYNYFTQGFTSGVDFESPDLIMATIAAASLASALLEGKRVYGLMHKFLQFNAGWSKRIIEGLGFDFDDLQANMANFRVQYNLRVDAFNKSITIPKNFTLLSQWGFLSGNIFTDTASPEYSTVFAWSLTQALKYNPTKLNTGTCLTWQNIKYSDEAVTVSDWFNRIDLLFAALNDSDVRSMFGAVRRVYNDSELLKLTELDSDYSTELLLHDTVSAQLHNCAWLDEESINGCYPREYLTPGASTEYNVAMYQTALGAIKSLVAVTDAEHSIPAEDETILDMYDHMVNPGSVIDLTAYMNLIDSEPINKSADGNMLPPNNSAEFYPVIYRTTIITAVFLFLNGDGVKVRKHPIIGSNAEATLASLKEIALISHIDSHPLLMVLNTNLHVECAIGEIDKYTKLNYQFLKTLNEQSLYQLLAMPANSKSTT